ncbi:hypothetical protein LTR37_019051 [Vermiconidia calcicola]|uniref:Uncharacterized protein n=1 Tax=Vermiconidia calcicola TaxID=1690605 RepID=A0ACC3MH34_9PEZI|nr:hypothetical protein LTR37_019051 [Vermiconidia calcicola]
MMLILLIEATATSALDARSETKVMDAIKEAVARGVTVLMIAHRLSTVLTADQITVLSEGRVVEAGTPIELAQEGTIFRGLLNAQNTSPEARPGMMDLDSAESLPTKGAKGSVLTELVAGRENMTPDYSTTDPPLRSIMSRFVGLTHSEHPIILFGILSSMVSGSMIIGEAIVFGSLVELLNTGEGSPQFQQEANFYCLMFFVLACVALVSYVGSGTAFGIASSRLVARVQTMLFDNVLHLDIAWFSESGRSARELASVFVKDSADLACLSGVALGTIFTVVVSMCGGIILAHVVAWKIAIVLLAAVPIMLVAGFVRLRLLAKSERRHRTAYSKATDLAVEACHNRTTVTILGLEDLNIDRYHQALRKPYKEGLASTVVCNLFLALSLAITYFVYALAYWWGATQVRNGSYTQKQFFTVLPALLFSAQSAGQLFSLSPEIARAKTAATSIFRLLSYRPMILAPCTTQGEQSPNPSSQSSKDRVLPEKSLKLELRNVTFTYSTSTESAVLSNVNLSIEEGETVALVGPSGAGKSSIIALLERFYDPLDGQILLDGANLKDIDARALRSRISLVPQEPELFPGSIEANVRYGITHQGVTHDMVEKACRQCGLHDFISSLPDGYNTDCGSIGNSQLSGGQRQRLALARALIRNPEVLLLDEPTSALDATSERQVQDALEEAAQGRTTIVIAHRLASIQHVDKIVVLEHGRVVEIGTHSQLMLQGGLYSSMAKAQALT